MKIICTLIFVSLVFTSCSKEAPIYTEIDIWKMASKVEPGVELVQISNNQPEKRIICESYDIEGCIPNSGRRLKVRLVEMPLITFQTEEQAKAAAKMYNQYYARNWLIDDVTNEPVLESFVKKAFNAKNPNLDDI